MSRKRFHGLKKVKVRATWNKINLYNLSRLKSPGVSGTYYQQKWTSKSATRAYHGEHIREKQWQRMFSPRLKAVIPMDHKYLASNDGSEFAAGRGSGKDENRNFSEKKFGRNTIPFMHMTYAPIERRLDMAVWRALFASSARQARQFCIHGMVKVNGQKMPYAGYLLNPGDMFQVEPDRVLFATGAPKTLEQIEAGKKLMAKKRKINRGIQPARSTKVRNIMKVAQVSEDPAASTETVEPAEALVDLPTSLSTDDLREQRKLDFRDLHTKIVTILKNRQRFLTVKRKQSLRALAKDINLARAQINRRSEVELDSLLQDFRSRFAAKKESVEPDATEMVHKEKPKASDKGNAQALGEAIVRARENPIDPTKPYATPWRPRPYMSAFAFIPRYLEVNHNICSAVYLRHPVARPGLAEVPTPFPQETQQLAFNWYLRRR